MTFVVPRRPLSILAAVGLFLLAAHPSAAATATYHLDGHVSRILGPTQTQNALGALGVKKGAAVAIDWTVELLTPFIDNPATNTKEYPGAITSFKIQIGLLSGPHWIALGVDAVQNVNTVFVGNNDNGPLDYMDLKRSGTDTNLLVTGNDPNATSFLGINLAAPSGGASNSNVLGDQDPSLYTANSGFVVGRLPNGNPSGTEVDFAIPGIAGPDPTVKCRSAQIASGGALCKATFTCLSKHANAPAKDPVGLVLEACREKARQKFLTSFDKAAAAAASKGLSCGDAAPGATVVSHFDAAVDDVVAVVDTVNPEVPALASSWYTAVGTMCAAVAKVESKNVLKPSVQKLIAARATARTKLTLAANKAVAKAESKGVVFDPQPDITALVDSIDALIDDIVTELNGP